VGIPDADPGPLFLGLDRAHGGHRLSDTSIYRIIRNLGKRAGLRARPHGLRHTAITDALDMTGGEVKKVQRFSRHKNLQTLLLYDDARKDEGGKWPAGWPTRSSGRGY
jgi:integrase/recombinase XerC